MGKIQGMIGGCGVGGVCSHNKAFGLFPFPTSKRSLYIEGLLGQHALGMLGPENAVIYGNYMIAIRR
jgi:hypothetical protein